MRCARAGTPATGRAQHLSAISIPMPFLQGRRDALANRELLAATAARLPSASLHFVTEADHNLHVPRGPATFAPALCEAPVGANRSMAC